MEYEDALEFLDLHVNVEALAAPAAALRLERMRALTDVLGDPQHQYPVLHLTGTNGKTSAARILGRLLVAKGLSVGSYTSPHLERVNERIAWNGEPISDDAFASAVAGVAGAVALLGDVRPTYFELLTAAAFRWFAEVALDAAVVEVGLGGRHDATNVADADVAVVTNVGIDHVEYLGSTREAIAREKAGIIKPGSRVVLGEADDALVPIFLAEPSVEVWIRGRDFACTDSRLAHGGRVLTLMTPGGRYDDVFLPLHGVHQGDNAAVALAAAEAFFGAPLDEGVVAEAFGAASSPGRLEVVRHRPLTVLDGAHNPDGARALGAALDEAFAGVSGRVVVMGLLTGRDPVEMLSALDPTSMRLVVACPPPSPRAMPADDVADAAAALGVESVTEGSVDAAVERALEEAAEDELVLVTGSLYTVGAARPRFHA